MAKFIHVCGGSGSGKTTLVQAVLEDPEINNLRYLTTFADRPPRQHEINYGSYEYFFVSPAMFDHIRDIVGPADWDEFEAYGKRKGVDRGYFRELLREGTNIILNSYPTPDRINDMKQLYTEAEHKIIYVHTDPEIAAARIVGERAAGERMRITIDREIAAEMEQVRTLSDATFECLGNKERDSAEFRSLVHRFLTDL